MLCNTQWHYTFSCFVLIPFLHRLMTDEILDDASDIFLQMEGTIIKKVLAIHSFFKTLFYSNKRTVFSFKDSRKHLAVFLSVFVGLRFDYWLSYSTLVAA